MVLRPIGKFPDPETSGRHDFHSPTKTTNEDAYRSLNFIFLKIASLNLNLLIFETGAAYRVMLVRLRSAWLPRKRDRHARILNTLVYAGELVGIRLEAVHHPGIISPAWPLGVKSGRIPLHLRVNWLLDDVPSVETAW